MSNLDFLIYFMLFICVSLIVSYTIIRAKQIRKTIEGLANNTLEITPEEFIKLRKESFGGRGKPSYALNLLVYIFYIIKQKIYIMLDKGNKY